MQSSGSQGPAPARRNRRFLRCALALTGGVLSLATLALATGTAQQNGSGANGQMPEKQDKQQSLDAANGARNKQLADDSAELLTMAMALKAEVDKTNKDTLSLNVIRKADEIEKLAHNVKEKMKLTVGGS